MAGRGALRMELYGCYESCSNPARLNVANRSTILDSQFEASTYENSVLSPRNARLSPPASCKGWRAGDNDHEPWIQVDFLRSTKVTAVLTQGRSSHPAWISKYVLLFGNDGSNFLEVLDDDGKPKEFPGSVTNNDIVRNTIKPAIFARFVRLKGLTWSYSAAARLEYEGCRIDNDWENSFPIGMESRLILDAQLSASSSKSSSFAAANARLNSTNPSVGGWMPAEDDLDPWLQVDFIGETTVTAIRIQMVIPSFAEATSFNVSYGNNESSLVKCRENGLSRMIYGVDSTNGDVKIYLQPSIRSRYLRMHPSDYSHSSAMKFEFYGHYQGCAETEALLSSDKFVLGQITGSSINKAANDNPFVRMDMSSAWIANNDDNDPWIKFDFLAPTKVCSIDSKGYDGSYVETFTVSFSNDDLHYQFYEEDGRRKTSTGLMNTILE
ncbi:EGF-like repeat and discoidin I-like domain-containing protein 3 [Dendronephthya gigantea]|uniref:EGF-like repeat and discoidin I-like domain-containing protein 3 n=1 Tax=Dendronephthya gigantea TaxID=151771 RepID=UPI00106A37B8|nr:EGF-like repeat and discoidin I-like domain-containing protein 3 [Dendronephthya gigantea]